MVSVEGAICIFLAFLLESLRGYIRHSAQGMTLHKSTYTEWRTKSRPFPGLISSTSKFSSTLMGPFHCYIIQWRGKGVSNFQKKGYEGERFNVISVTKWWSVQFPGKKHYVRLEWPL